MEVIRMQIEESYEPQIYGVKIYNDGKGGHHFSFRHTGQFKLGDYEQLDLEIASARLVKRE